MIYESPIVGTVIVPVGFETDLASVPRIPLAYLLTGGKANVPAILHDYLYVYGGCTRREADDAFMECMQTLGDPKSGFKRWLMYTAVRLFGGGSWRHE